MHVYLPEFDAHTLYRVFCGDHLAPYVCRTPQNTVVARKTNASTEFVPSIRLHPLNAAPVLYSLYGKRLMVWAGFQKYTWIYISAFAPMRPEPIVAPFLRRTEGLRATDKYTLIFIHGFWEVLWRWQQQTIELCPFYFSPRLIHTRVYTNRLLLHCCSVHICQSLWAEGLFVSVGTERACRAGVMRTDARAWEEQPAL